MFLYDVPTQSYGGLRNLCNRWSSMLSSNIFLDIGLWSSCESTRLSLPSLPLCSDYDWSTGLRVSAGGGATAPAVYQAMVSLKHACLLTRRQDAHTHMHEHTFMHSQQVDIIMVSSSPWKNGEWTPLAYWSVGSWTDSTSKPVSN